MSDLGIARISELVRVRVRVRVRGLFFAGDPGIERSRNRTRLDGVCGFEKVPLYQLCPSAIRVRVSVRSLTVRVRTGME